MTFDLRSDHFNIMPKFRKETGSSEFHTQKQPSKPQSIAPAAGTSADTASQLAQFYANLVETSGHRWATSQATQPLPQQEPSSLHPPLKEQPPSSAVEPASDQQLSKTDTNNAEQQHSSNPTALGLGATLPVHGIEIIPPGQRYPEPAGPALPPASTGVASVSQQPARIVLSSTSMGFKLLEKAGWTPGTGIGAREQGIQEPIQAEALPNKVGLGFAPKAQKVKAGGSKPGEESEKQKQQQQQKAVIKRPLPEDPLDKEDLDTKVKRVRQVGDILLPYYEFSELG